MKKSKQKVIYLYVFVITFFIMCLLPFISLFLNFSNKENCENRNLTKKPKFEFTIKYLCRYGEFFEDNFSLKNSFIFWQASIKKEIFSSSSNPKNIMIGKNSYLFYCSKPDFIYESYSRRNLLNKNKLFEFKQIHEKRKSLLATKNCEYIVAVWPNKSSIYKDYLPLTMKMQIEDTITKVQQIEYFLKKEKANFDFISVYNDLILRKNEVLYLKNDTHWNNLGAYYAYKSFMNKTKKYFHQNPLSIDNFFISNEKHYGGDLINMLGLCSNKNYWENEHKFILKNNAKIKDNEKIPGSYGKINPHAPVKKKVIFFRDSFGSALIQFFSAQFEESYFFWSDYNQEIVDKIKPDVVVVSKAERYL